jgi:hypothetical protein
MNETIQHLKEELDTRKDLMLKMSEKILSQQEQLERELADNNGLRASIGILSQALVKITKYHKDCSTCDNCDLDYLKDILKEKSEAILKL